MPTVGLKATPLDLVIVRGDDIEIIFSDPTETIFATGDTFIATLKQGIDDGTPTPVLFTMDYAQLGSGILRMTLTDTITEDFNSGAADEDDAFPKVWDLQRTRGGLKRTIYKGIVTVEDDVTL